MSQPAGSVSARAGLLPWLSVTMAAIYVAIGGVVAVLVPAQVARIDPQGKVAALAIISSLSFTVTLFAQPLIGLLSDRTRRTRGGRAIWVLGSAAVGALAVGSMGLAGSIPLLCLLWAVGQFALNGADIATSSYVVDSYPVGRRGTPSGVLAASVALGTGIGAVVAAALVGTPAVAFAVMAGVALLAAVSFAVHERDRLMVTASLAASPWGERWRSFSIRRLDPRRYPDFSWALATRFLFTLGQQGVSVYLLYIVADISGVGDGRAPLIVSALTATGLVGLLVSAFIAGMVSDRLARRRAVLVVSSVVLTLAMVLPLLWRDVPVMFVFAGLQGVALGGHLATGSALISEVLPGGNAAAGRDLGLANVAINAAQALAPLVAGAAILIAGGYEALFVVAIAAAAASAVCALRVRAVR